MRYCISTCLPLMIIGTPASAIAQASDRRAEMRAINERMGMLQQELDALRERMRRLEDGDGTATVPAAVTTTTLASASPVTGSAPDAPRAAGGAPSASAFALPAVADVGDTPPAPPGKAFTSYAPSIAISGSTAGSTATVTLGNFPQLKKPATGDWFGALSQRLELSAPLDRSGGPTRITNLDSLADGAKAKFTLSWYSRRVGSGDVPDAALTELAKIQQDCVDDAKTRKGPLTATECLSDDKRTMVLRHYGSRQLRRTFQDSVAPGRFAYAAGASVALGYKNFKFVDTSAVTMDSAERFSKEVGGYLTILPTAVASSATVSLAYQWAYKEGAAGVLCPAGRDPSQPISCLTGAQGGPTNDRKGLIALDYRRYLPALPIVGRTAISPQVTYDWSHDEYAFDLPFYFVPDEKSKLIGGLRLGYGTKEKEFVAGVFIGAPFSIFR
ncbi:hypothetical protein [Sphingomonas sp. GM_Shp_2]|uniref:hypothetical protein n=1 Tax=Sphingomonas sp. GM_Shp_2 TaxID=2937380 RepID=UPI00226AB010|nr:hypothetical protein [Sphingomonas sp. GM_Shp_2]